MRWTKLMTVAMLMWGHSVFAALPPEGPRAELSYISSWMAYFHQEYPSMKLGIAVPLNSPQSIHEALEDLESLDKALHGVENVPAGSLTTLACPKAVCLRDGDGEI